MVELRDHTDDEESSSSSDDDFSSTSSDSSSSSDGSEAEAKETGEAVSESFGTTSAGSEVIPHSTDQPEKTEIQPTEITEPVKIVGPRSPADEAPQDEDDEGEADASPSRQDRSVNPVSSSSSGLEQAEDNIELDYDIDIAQDLTAADLNPSEPVQASEADGKGDEEEGEDKKPTKSSPSKKIQPKKVKTDDGSDEEGELTDSDSDGELTTTDEEEVAKVEVEDGEIQDGRNFNARTQLCRFFARGLCTWGFTCRFLHPGVNDKGNYHMIERPGMRLPPGTYKPPEEEKEEKEEEEEPEEDAEEPEEPPKPETPWERGLRQAKEALKRASRKKEMELDIEDKKMHMTLDEVKNKESNAGRDPYYDNLQYDELDPIQAMAFEEHHRDDNWEKAGFEDTFEVEWTQANYELPHQLPPPEREWRDERMRGLDPRRGYDRGARQRYRSPGRSSHRDYRDRRPQERRGLQRHALGSDGWVDPWQRVKPGERRRRRHSSSGSSSFSSLSGSSRRSSPSSFSSRSRSRTRTPTPLRNIQKPKSNVNQSNVRSDERGGNDESNASQPLRPQRKGPEWPTGPANADRPGAIPRDKMAPGPKDPLGMGVAGSRLSRKDQPPGGRKDRGKFKRRGSSVSSSSSSSSDSSSSRSRSSSSSDSSDSSSSGSSSSSSSSDSSASDSDELYAGISKPHKEKRQKKPLQRKKPKERERRLPPSKPAAIARKQQVEEKVREKMTSTSKAGIKLTLVNKTKVPSKKRVLDSPPPEPLPPSKKATLPMPEAVERPKPPVPKVPVAASNSSKAAPPKPTAAIKPSKQTSKAPTSSKVSAAASAKKTQPNRREELLKQLKAVEEAIAKKRSKT